MDEKVIKLLDTIRSMFIDIEAGWPLYELAQTITQTIRQIDDLIGPPIEEQS
jgi:hypothetical protein